MKKLIFILIALFSTPLFCNACHACHAEFPDCHAELVSASKFPILHRDDIAFGDCHAEPAVCHADDNQHLVPDFHRDDYELDSAPGIADHVRNDSGVNKSRHVILITIDGFRPEFYLEPQWGAITMQDLFKQGLYSEGVTSIFPSVTYPSHTTIITGKYPDEHRILYNAPFEPLGSIGKWNWYYDSIMVPTIFEELRKKGLSTAAVLWPVTIGAPIDFNVPEIWATTKDADRVEPMKKNTTPLELWTEIEQNATGTLHFNDLNAEFMAFDQNIARIAAYLFKAKKPNFLAVHFATPDEYQHSYGTNDERVHKAVLNTDNCIQQLLDAVEMAHLKDSTTIIITGDHRFTDVTKTVMPNVVLANAGLIRKKDNKVEDWDAKFQATGGAAFLYINSRADSAATVKKVLHALQQIPNANGLFTIIEKKDLLAMGCDHNIVLALAAVDGVFLGGADSGDVLRGPVQKGAHGFSPSNKKMNTGLIIAGSTIKHQEAPITMQMTDIAPFILSVFSRN